jgi:intracellular sulfur oxidation DsrE/DsrF family protein
MEENNSKQTTDRRKFLGNLATGAAALGIASIAAPLGLNAENSTAAIGLPDGDDHEAWFKEIKGKHRIVFDVVHPNGVFPFAWPKIFLVTNEMTGTTEKDTSVVVVLRHDGIPYAMEDRLWKKYNLGEVFHVPDPVTQEKVATRNPFWNPKPGDFQVPGLGNVAIGINELQASGVRFCVCNMALTVYSAAVAQGMKLDPAEVKKDWVSGLLPNIHVVPSGVWAIGRAQEHNCGYIFTG